jgi:N-methylhydantoinase A/oxoprolinase/acetone carboxylase beta subunit
LELFLFLGQPADIEVEKNEQEEQVYDEILSVSDDEYQRILEDLELMAEERMKTLVEASNRELSRSAETPAKSVHPTFSEVRTATNSKSSECKVVS